MKIETPQILWHNGSEGNGKPAPLYSVSLLPSPPSSSSTDNSHQEGHILATAGNTNEVHIWNINVPTMIPTSSSTTTTTSESSPTQGQNKRQKILSTSSSTISLITSITRHQRSINTIAFSPLGSHLASAGDGGSLIIHTVPMTYRQSMNTIQHFWRKVLNSEKDLNSKILNTHTEDIMDVCWSNDERRIVIGSLDHSVFVFEEGSGSAGAVALGLDVNSNNNSSSVSGVGVGGGMEWNCVWRNTKEHTHYVQGVAYDPLGVYLASQGSDRSVRVWQRKRSGKKGSGKKKVLAVMDGNVDDKSSSDVTATDNAANRGSDNTNHTTTSTTNEILMGKFEVGKAKMLKYRTTTSTPNNNLNTENSTTNDEKAKLNSTSNTNNTNVKNRYLFADESTVESFFRRLAWTNDGAFLITPAALWHSKVEESENVTPTDSERENALESSPSFATHLFARHQFERPFKVLSGLEKPSVVIRPNPVLFKLPNKATSDLKENLKQNSSSSPSSSMDKSLIENMPYRSIFAVLTIDSVLIYDTFHSRPLCIARGLHYAGLTDCSWTSDGKNLIVCSTDGYISILTFGEGELGEVYYDEGALSSSPVSVMGGSTGTNMTNTHIVKNVTKETLSTTATIAPNQSVTSNPTTTTATIQPCERGQSATIYAPPSKKARVDQGEKKRIAPTLLSTTSTTTPVTTDESKETKKEDEEEVVGAVTNLSINNEMQNNMNQIKSTC